ncbi:MAG: gliding motility-associated C-terminal domain-containing protein, partial [Cyclobacteriaceae bacterium]
YQISYLDTCGGSWNTKKTSPPFIRSKALEPNKYQIELDQAIFPANESVSYSGILSGNDNEITTPISSTSFELTIPPTVGSNPVFIVQGFSDSLEFASNPLTLAYEFVIKVPKAFTPNGDGLNDRLEFFGIDNSQAELKIYTRWGQQVYYEISSAPSWDGRINGTVASDGIYVYEISVPQISNQVQKGTFALLKR